MSRCDRIYYPIQQIAIAKSGTSSFIAVNGLQTFSVGVDTPLSEVFQIGKLSPRTQLEDLPDVNMSMDKDLDGYPLIYHLATLDATSPTLAGRASSRCTIALSVFDPSQECATGVPIVSAQMTGSYYTNISYNFGVSGMFKENVSFVSNDIIVSNDDDILNTDEQSRAAAALVNGQFTGEDDAYVNKREHMIFDYIASTLDTNGQVADADCTILPSEVDGISDSGTNEVGADGARLSDVQSISISAGIQRERKEALGSFEPVCQIVRFPVEITTEITVKPRTFGLKSATAIGILNTGTSSCVRGPRNRKPYSIRVATCEGTRIYLGTQNKMRSENYSDGGVGGGDVTVSYSYRTLNDFTVMHENDPHTSGATWWTNREDYLLDT